MKPCPGNGCKTRISDNLTFCARCSALAAAYRPFDAAAVSQFAAEGLAALEHMLSRHAEFDAWLTHHPT